MQMKEKRVYLKPSLIFFFFFAISEQLVSWQDTFGKTCFGLNIKPVLAFNHKRWQIPTDLLL